MLVNTAVMGTVEVEECNVFHLPDGLYGFDKSEDLALITQEQEDMTLMWMQSVHDSIPCFVVFDPVEIIDGFAPQIDKSDLLALGCESADDLSFYVIAVIPTDIRYSTVNLKSPIVVNKKTRLARQIILLNREYPIQFALFAQES